MEKLKAIRFYRIQFPKCECEKKNLAKMSLKLKDFAKSDAGSENVSRGTVEDSSDDEISYLPPG